MSQVALCNAIIARIISIEAKGQVVRCSSCMGEQEILRFLSVFIEIAVRALKIASGRHKTLESKEGNNIQRIGT